MDDLTQAKHDLAMMQARYNVDVAALEQQLAASLADTTSDERAGLLSEASFGSFDGLTSVSGVVITLLANPISSIVKAAIGLAVASAIGMAAGEYLGDRKLSGALKRASVMGLATLVGTIAPTIPFLFVSSKLVAVAAAAVIAVLMTTAIGRVRQQGIRGYLASYVILGTAISATALIGAAIPASVGA